MLVAVAKPSGLAVHRGWSDDRVFALQLVRDAVGCHVYPVHRLDRATSGVLLFAKRPEIAAIVQKAFEASEVDKRYLALVRGVVREPIEIDHPIPRGESGERVPARTSVWPRAGAEGYTLVEARPHTGRLHQIRRHLKHVSHPIIGDVRYGKGEHNRRFRSEFDLHRLALHAASLTLPHPVSGQTLILRAPVPDDLALPLRRLGIDVGESSHRA